MAGRLCRIGRQLQECATDYEQLGPVLQPNAISGKRALAQRNDIGQWRLPVVCPDGPGEDHPSTKSKSVRSKPLGRVLDNEIRSRDHEPIRSKLPRLSPVRK